MKLIPPLLLALAVAILWVFPAIWYKELQPDSNYLWFGEATNVVGWDVYREIPLGQAAEAVLSADRIVNAEFKTTNGRRIGVYSAKRYNKKDNEVGLFSHTPDRCWTIAGWRIEPLDVDAVTVGIHGTPLVFERRLFRFADRRELVYFSALVGGRPLPYRMNQYYSGASDRNASASVKDVSIRSRLFDGRFWGWAWSSFINRTPMSGPQQFLRVSTPIENGNVDAADIRLKEFLPQWMMVTNFNSEASTVKKTQQ